MAFIEIKNLTFSYPQSEAFALKDVSLTVEAGDFLVLCGPSGCGKSTFLRHLKPQLTPVGSVSGEILFKGKSLNSLSQEESSREIGFVQQSPENQAVTDKVWHELAFGLESLGLPNETIRRRVAEMASFFGIENWFYRNVSELSGGQKQIMNLASVMVMQPQVLILDEPTSQLDPIASQEFLQTLKRINNELGTTVILSEHRLEEAIPLSSKVAVMDKGEIISTGTAQEVAVYLKSMGNGMFQGMPTSMRVWASVEANENVPVSVNEGKGFLKEYTKNKDLNRIELPKKKEFEEVKIQGKELWFKYEKNGPDIIKGADFTVHKGEFYCLLGGNGTGKTTLLKVLSGYERAYRGKLNINGKISMLPQNPETLFLKKSLYEDFLDCLKATKLTEDEKLEEIGRVVSLCDLQGLEGRHPFDLSGGEKQRAALAKLLLLKPDILLLDEATKGFDVSFKKQFASILENLLKQGVTIVMVSHDVEFCARYAHTCGLFFDGKIITENEPKRFFMNNSFYTPAANRIARGIIDNAVTTEDIIYAIGGKSEEPENPDKKDNDYSVKKIEEPKREKKNKLPLWRKILGGICGTASFIMMILISKTGALSEAVDVNGITKLGKNQLLIYGIFFLLLVLTGLFVSRKSTNPYEQPLKKKKLTKRTTLAVFLILLLIPITLFIGVFYLDKKQYYVTALLILFECMLPFFMVFEGRKPKARELVTIAVLCGLSIAGRAAFIMVPQFKPVIALTIISGVALGGETGFLVGAVTMLVSNILFSQGPWTPWQMFAAGIIGFLAGILYRKGFLGRSRASLCVFGAITTIVIYGGIMNPSSALLWGAESLNLKMILGYYVTGFPMDLIHAFATVIFLWFLGEPMLEKLDRIKVKYGLIE